MQPSSPSTGPVTLREVAPILVPGLLVIIGAFVVSRCGLSPSLVLFLDNLHWTVAYALGAGLAWWGLKRAPADAQATRRWFALGLTAYAFGQVVWDVQIAVNWNPFPGPSDLFYSSLGPACLLGLWSSLRVHLSKEQLRTALLDACTLAVAVLVLTLSLYLPKQGDTGPLALAVLVSYPVTLLGALCFGVILILSLRATVSRSWVVFMLALLAQGIVWMHWNSLTLDDALQDGTWFNFSFSVATVALGLGAMWWRPQRSTEPGWDRVCEWLLRVLPVLSVVIAAASLFVLQLLPPVSGAMQLLIGLGVAGVIALAMARQSLLLAERDRLLVAEQQVRENESRFRVMFDSNLQGVFFTNPGGGISQANDAFLRMTGFSRADLEAGRVSWKAMTPPEHAARDEQAIRELAATGVSQPWEKEYFRKDGSRIPVIVGAAYVEGGQDEAMAFALDITALKQAERMRDHSLSLMRAALESTADGILVVNQEGKIETFNGLFARMWRLPEDVLASRDDARAMQCVLDQLSNPQAFTAKVAYLYAHAREESFDRVEFKDGRVFERYSRPQVIGGQVVGRVWSFRDITERQSLEVQLRQSQKMEAIGQLSGGIAHDFNNLLTAIIGHLGLLRGNPQVTPLIAESLGEISAAANRAANLTSQLLAFSRRQVISISALDLNEVVTNLSKMLRRVLGEQVSVQLDFAPEPLSFQGDAGMMEQVLVNLAVNARDAMPEGGTLRIATRREIRQPPATERTAPAVPGEFVRLSVSDTGTGIPPEIRSRIFEPFFTTKGVGKGTGLGLATVFGIMQQHHGWIEVESEVGRGTTFHLYLPLMARQPARIAGEEPGQPVQPARGRGELILLVEDEPAVQQIVMKALDRYGYRVVPAANGPEALKVWAERRADIALLLTDLIMPEGMSGLQLARQLTEQNPQLRVVYSSGYSAEIAGKEMRMTAGVNYLAKPYELEQLFRTVRLALDRKQSRSPF